MVSKTLPKTAPRATRKTAARKASASNQPAAKAGAEAKPTHRAVKKVAKPPKPPIAPIVAAAEALTKDDDTLKRPEILELIAERTGMKKKDVRPAMDALLQLMGEALADGREIATPLFGRIKVTRVNGDDKRKVSVCKYHPAKKRSEPENTALAETDTTG